jgi:hypothetical protein
MASCCEHGIEPLSSIKSKEFKMVKQSHYKLGMAQRVPGSQGSQIS